MTNAIHMDQQVPQENQSDENLQSINAPAEPAPAAPAAPESEPAASAAKPEGGIGKIDLSALAGFSFGTQWTSANAGGGERREGRGDRGARPERRSFSGGDRPGGEVRRDRRPSGRPFKAAGSDASEIAQGASGEARPERPFQGDRGPGQGGNFRRDRQGGPQGGYRGERGPAGEQRGERRFERGPRFERGAPQDNRPYVSPYFDVTFYAEDAAFSALVKAVRASCHTYELFEIARVVLGKNDRFVVVVQRKPDAEGKRAPLFVTPIDGLPFENEDEAVQHVLRNHLGDFFTMTEAEVEPPKGNFQFVMRCGMTGELLGPPNYHRYQNILQQHHAAKLGNMPFERFRERLETVREPEIIAQWMEKMKKVTRYVWKEASDPAAAPTFDTIEDARTYLLANARDKVVRSVESARFHGKVADQLPEGEIRAAAEGQLDRQRRFPLDTANALRGRLRREGFTIFKRGSKGVSYVCSVKRKFRLPGQVFSESISALIDFIEKNPVVSVKELPAKHLGINQPEAPAEGAAPIPPEDDAKLKRLWMDLRWLVTEGYVTEYSDGKLFAAPPMTAQQQKSEEAANAAADAVEEAARAAAGSPQPTESESAAAEPAAQTPSAEEPPSGTTAT
ncbi:MAG TPA: hypothetical protein VK163_10570 [Opitutaceae bacterium]|nr:hypothetical protein [Opitutaceae bacterium]